MKIGFFTDSHYCSRIQTGPRFNSKSLGKIKNALKDFEREKCDLIV